MTILNQPSAQIIVDQINQDNALSLTVDQINFGAPTAVTGAGKRDTDIPVTAVAGKGYVGSNVVNLDRLKGELLFLNYIPKIVVDSPASTADLLPAINARFGFQITAAEILNTALNAPGSDGSITQLITFLDSCLAYEGKFTVIVNTGTPVQDGVLLTEDGTALTTEDAQPLALEA
jgi:hypothetical protein